MLLEEARSFIEMMYRELNYNPSIFDKRIKEIEKEIEHTGTYTHTLEELSYGAKLAWRNSNRRIGRLFWDSLNVEDARNVDNERDFIDTINHHLEHATNNGKIKPYITIFHLIKHLVSIIINLLDMLVMNMPVIHLNVKSHN